MGIPQPLFKLMKDLPNTYSIFTRGWTGNKQYGTETG